MHFTKVTSVSSLRLLLEMIPTGSYVSAPLYTVGRPVTSTPGATANVTLLSSSVLENMCSEVILTSLGVNKFDFYFSSCFFLVVLCRLKRYLKAKPASCTNNTLDECNTCNIQLRGKVKSTT